MYIGRLTLVATIVAIAGYIVMRWLVVLNSPTPADLGVHNGQLRPCPDSPNCVSSTGTDTEHSIEPLPYVVPTAQMQEQLLAVLKTIPRATIITAQPDYVHVELRTQLMGFVDDAEFYFDETHGVLHMRSGSRLGYSDMGVNRRNLEQIRSALAE